MAEEAVISVELKEFPAMKSLGDFPKVQKAISREYSIAGRRVGIVLAKEMRAVIRGGHMPDNHPVTVAFKRGSSKPLAGTTGRLFKAITYKVSGVSDRNNVVLVGVMRSNGAANVARIVHEGTKIKVTPRMSLLFKAVLSAARGKGAVRSARGQELLNDFDDATGGMIAPFRVGTTLIIPPRPFAKVVLENPKTRRLITREYSKALERAVAKLTAEK